MLVSAGCRILSDQRVSIPEPLVRESVQAAPAAMTIYNRAGQTALDVQGVNEM